MRAPHKVPTHMQIPDKVVFGLTTRQLLILLIGCSSGYDLWLQLHALGVSTVVGLILRVGIAVLPVVAALALALLSVAGRTLEVWFLVLLRYWRVPQTYVWRSLRTGQRTEGIDHLPHSAAHKREQEDLERELMHGNASA
jgi:PrgI family protein